MCIFCICSHCVSFVLLIIDFIVILHVRLIRVLLKINHICFRLLVDDTRINFWFRLLVTWSSPHGHGASSHIIWCKRSLSSPKLLTFFRNSRWRPPPSWIFLLREFGHSGVLIVWYLCSVPNLVQTSVIVTEIDAHRPMLQTFIWWRHVN